MTKRTLSLRSLVLAVPLALFVGCDGGATVAPDGELTTTGVPISAAKAESGRLVRTVWPSSEDPGAPFYARLEHHALIAGGWAVIPFYREPDCVVENRPEFNLILFFDAPAAFACALTVSGFSLWHGAVGNGSPHTVVSEGNGAVPMWFVPEDQMIAAMADGEVTITELAALPGLLIGYATHFHELLHPSPLPPEMGGGGHPVPKLVLNARGQLEDGRSFNVHFTVVAERLRTGRINF
jgi:hypothetical protein